MKRLLIFGLKLLLSVLLILYLFNSVDLERTWSLLLKASPTLIVLSAAVLSLQFFVSTIRWRLVLKMLGVSMDFVKTLHLTYVGTFFNQALPSAVGGDAVRIYKAHKAGLSLSQSVNSVMLERVATVLGLLVLAMACQMLLISRIDMEPIKWLVPVLCVAGISGTALLMTLDRFPTAIYRWKLVRGLASLGNDTRTIFLHRRKTLHLLALAVIGHINISVGVWLLGLALNTGEQLSLLNCTFLIPLALLVTTLPISIGGWGVREASFVTALGFIGISAESALVLSVLFGVLTIVISLPGGILWLVSTEQRQSVDEQR